ncbi:MAG: tetratricopeptide repeat protein [Candidatus Poseidoniaceae archaeon]|jgi:Flp pilus assembly protein TadD|nr:tetratricopeptide repeat protein [Candidatus Poseidoniaceae archaeon]
MLDDVPIDDEEIIPGLEDVVSSMGGETVAGSNPQHSLPFGMGAQAEVIESNLPFGVGSLTSNIEKITSGLPIVEPEKMEVEFEPAEQTPVIDESENNSSDMEAVTENITSDPIRIDAKPVIIEEELPTNEPAPDMWKLEAAAVDMDEIYSQQEQVVEVTFADEYSTDDVIVKFDEFHHESTEPSLFQIDQAPQLHPARALIVDFDGDTELETRVRSSFEHMGNGAWMQAAQELSAANRDNPNDSPLLNNLGLALLQNALEMDSKNDPLADTQYEAAIMSLRQAAKIETSNDTILVNLAHALLVSGRVDKALGVIKVVAERNPENPESANIRGACLLQLGKLEDAKRIFSAYSNDEYCRSNLLLI